jgi:hypothetical protein
MTQESLAGGMGRPDPRDQMNGCPSCELGSGAKGQTSTETSARDASYLSVQRTFMKNTPVTLLQLLV